MKMTTQNLLLTMLPVAILTATALQADSVYQDPQGRFTIMVPTNWRSSAGDGALQLSRGDAYATLLVVTEQGSPEEMLSQVIGQMSRQWKDAKQMGSPQATLGGQPAAFTLITGTNPRGVPSFGAVYAANVGGQMYVLIESGPMSQYRELAQDMDKIATSFAQGQSSRSSSGPAPVKFASQSSPTPAYAPSGAGSNYEAPDHSVSFQVPSGWKARTADLSGTPIQVVEREGGDEKILVNSGPATANSIQELAQQAAQLVTQQLFPGFRVASSPRFSQ